MASAQSYSVQASFPSALTSPLGQIPVPTFFPTEGKTSWIYTLAAIVLSLLALEQGVYRYKKAHLPGSKWTIPVIGKFADSMNPTMEGYLRQWQSGALSALSVFNIFIVMASSNEYSVKIFNSPAYAEPCLVNSAKQILMPDNWVFLNGKAHVEYRKGLNVLFTRKALGIYCHMQDMIARKHFARWLENAKKNPSAQPIMFAVRNMNMDTSLRVFCGRHIPEHATQEINDKYWLITRALELVNFPLAFPGTKIYSAIQARKVAINWLSLAAKNSKISMAAGNEPECMLDAWVKELADPVYKGRREFSDREMAMVLFSFLFASQDAMSSGLIYAFQHLADRPDMLAKIRAESDRVRGNDPDKPLTLEMLDEMYYLRAFVKESLRLKPPVTMVPYRCTKSFNITPDYTVPANSMLIPSTYPSLHDPSVYPEPDSLNPDRWLDPESSANKNPRNYLVFGSGPHRCIGYEYVYVNIAICLSDAITLMEWEHEVTPLSEEVEIIATLFPKDGCKLKLRPRERV
ncbi:cytochrome P450 sterol C22-desaturase [Fomitiporia mediterranea MF3/22]|uniref:cytochrome P450 sterol C22-desaturase n=1 Tax=Fomitiporia mediterranea (strain MF3/22) TaxID=694068 RepID=UPI0004408F94|nr:cytochrome P450 sterol C22-desaturase [Fomitiporia mediterranea MF3/22]EJD04247.1 cytochrome P450 sterol C22-desaturase [Fomitiporia mediterranea MF3/22]